MHIDDLDSNVQPAATKKDAASSHKTVVRAVSLHPVVNSAKAANTFRMFWASLCLS